MQIKLDEGFQFGLGAFETIAVENGKAVLLEKHLRRLQRAADFLKLGNIVERGITEDTIYEYLVDHSVDRGALKIMLSRENCMVSERKNPYTEESYRKGFKVDISSVMRNESSSLVYHKTMNYGDCILEKRAAADAGMNERFFLNTKGQICEGTVSNVFFVRKNKIFTPELSCGLLPGIMREYLMEHQDVTETEIYPEQLKYYEECFVTNSLMGIMPVVQIGDRIFTERKTADRLREEYRSLEVNK